jgi:hypothetical protein
MDETRKVDTAVEDQFDTQARLPWQAPRFRVVNVAETENSNTGGTDGNLVAPSCLS